MLQFHQYVISFDKHEYRPFLLVTGRVIRDFVLGWVDAEYHEYRLSSARH